jgi:hypothetical protein
MDYSNLQVLAEVSVALLGFSGLTIVMGHSRFDQHGLAYRTQGMLYLSSLAFIAPCKVKNEYFQYLFEPWDCSRTKLAKHHQTPLRYMYVTGQRRPYSYQIVHTSALKPD